jgi:propanol-preferring alcohol dehydrogenase
VFAFTRAGGSEDAPPKLLDAAIIFAPAGELVPVALKAVKKGGTVVCGGIHMSDIPLTTRYPLSAANEAVNDLRSGRIQGAAVLVAP